MVRMITYDNVVEERINAFFENKCCHSGLIVGQCTDKRDIVIRLCSTPAKDEIAPIEYVLANPIELDDQWISQHAKQLMRALPGGLDILGFYIVANSDYTTSHQTQLRQLLFTIYNKLGENKSLQLYSNDRILLTICPTTKNIICKTYKVTDYRSPPTVVDWKLQTAPIIWQQVQCNLPVDIKFPIKSEDAGLSLQKQIELGLRSFLQNVQEAYPLINGKQRDLNSPLDGRRSKKKSETESENDKCYNVELAFPVESNNNISNTEVCECTCMMTFEGVVHCRAFVHPNATVQEAIKALKLDVIRSITARCEIHCEDLLLIEGEQEDPVVGNELPRRVFAPLPQPNLSVCDYQFHYNMAVDSLEAFKELLNLEVTEEDIDMSCEQLANLTDLDESRIQELASEFRNQTESPSFYKCISVALIGAALALFVGIFLVYYVH